MKPGDFLLGLLDFFAILLPGSLATWLAVQYVPPEQLDRALRFGMGSDPSVHTWVLGTAFFVSSYVLGHFVFMVGAQLDDSYDRWRQRAKPAGRDKTFQAARKLYVDLTGVMAEGEFTTLKWAKAYVQIHVPEARGEIDRLEADSKFFRSLVIVSIAFAAHFLLREQAPMAGAAALGLSGLSYRRYREQRWKLTELSYATAVIAHATKASGTVTQP